MGSFEFQGLGYGTPGFRKCSALAQEVFTPTPGGKVLTAQDWGGVCVCVCVCVVEFTQRVMYPLC